MKKAVVFGARQPFGFELCTELLERGYSVYGVDHESWMTEKQEEKWLLIGRNANLDYEELKSSEDLNEQIIMEQESLYIIPIIDYLFRQSEEVKKQLVSQLIAISGQKGRRKAILFFHPASIDRSDASFIGRLTSVIESMKENSTIIEYFLPDLSGDSHTNIMVDYLGNGKRECIGHTSSREDLLSSIVMEVIDHIEKNRMFDIQIQK